MTRRASHLSPLANNNPSIVISSGARPLEAERAETMEQTMASPVMHQKITRTFL